MKLVIAEKPSVANSIADVLGADKKEDGYRTGNGYMVSWCVGHLVELAAPDSYGEQYKKWSYDTLPIIPEEYHYEVKSDTKKQFNVLKRLMNSREVDTVVCATDAGREGELIFRLVYDRAGCKKPVERLWISSMEESAIREGFEHLKSSMLDFEEFKQEIKDNIKDFLPEEFQDASVDFNTVTKNNGMELEGIMIRQPDSNIAPNIYVNQLFEDYEAGRDMNDIMTEIADTRVEHDIKQDIDISGINNFDNIKDSIIPKLVNAEMNEEQLADRPHDMVDDLAVTYAIVISKDENGMASLPITNELFENYDISQDELHDIAIANMETLEPPTFKSMHDTMIDSMLGEMTAPFGGDEEAAKAFLEDMLPPEEVPMFVVSNEMKLNGATSVLDDKLMDKVTEQLGEDFFVIPSSVHECIVIPNDGDMDAAEITSMIQEVNATQVLPQERLSDHAYIYDSDQHQLVRADREMEQELSADISKEAVTKDRQEAPSKEEKSAEAPENKEPEKKKDTITIKCGKGFVSEPFTAKDGKEYRQVKIPNKDENDKSPWASFVVKSNQIHENQYGKGMWLKLPEEGNTTIRRDVKVGEKDGKGVYEKTETKLPNKELKAMVESYKTRSNEQDKDQTKDKEKGSSLQDRIANKKQKIEEKQKNEPEKEHSKKKEASL